MAIYYNILEPPHILCCSRTEVFRTPQKPSLFAQLFFYHTARENEKRNIVNRTNLINNLNKISSFYSRYIHNNDGPVETVEGCTVTYRMDELSSSCSKKKKKKRIANIYNEIMCRYMVSCQFDTYWPPKKIKIESI